MTQPSLYPRATWIVWILVVPFTLLVVGIGLAATTRIGDLPFDNADLWWLGGVVPLASLLCLYGMTRRRRSMARFVSNQLTPLLATGVSPTRQALRASLLIVSMLLMVVALLGPRWGIYMEKQKVRGVDVVVAVDVSRSMLAEDLTPNRLERAKQEIRRQLTERAVFRNAHRLGLLAFAGSTSLRVPLTSDHLAFRSKLQALQYGSAPRGGTAIAEAIRAATDLFSRSPGQATKIILLFTDGEDHEGGPAEAAREAFQDHGIRVFAIGVGDPSRAVGAEVPSSKSGENKPLLFDGQIVFSKVDVEGLKQIAKAGGGQYAPLQDLPAMVNGIAGMWKAELTTEERQRHIPRYQWFLAAALLLLGLEIGIRDHQAKAADLPTRIWQQEEAA